MIKAKILFVVQILGGSFSLQARESFKDCYFLDENIERRVFVPEKLSIVTCETDDSVNLLQFRKSERHYLANW